MSKLDPLLDFLGQESTRDLNDLAGSAEFGVGVNSEGASTVSVLVQHNGAVSELEARGLAVRAVAGDVVSGDIAVASVATLAALDSVVFVEAAYPVRPSLDISRSEVRADQAHARTTSTTPPRPLRGGGVLVGVIDSGIDYRHAYFRKADDSTRLVAIWDQNLTANAGESPPAAFSYGVEYSQADIDRALAAADPVSIVRHLDDPSPQVNGHGTHVASTAAGHDRSGAFSGVAPDADLVVVALDFSNSTRIVDAIRYIFDLATVRGQPAVVNMSLGATIGPHDGTSVLARGVDRLTGDPGRAVVAAAGNAANDDAHAQGRLTVGSAQNVTFNVVAGTTRPVVLDLWYAGSDRIDVSVTDPSGNRSAVVTPGNSTGTVTLANNDRLFISSNLNNPNNHDNQIRVLLLAGTAPGDTIQPGAWTLDLNATTATSGRFDVYLSGSARFSGSHNHIAGTVESPGTSREVITVGAYVTRGAGVGGIAAFSSRGPTRDGRIKPDLTAPGALIQAARAVNLPSGSGLTHGMQGTSMATPHVAGTVALMLQKNPGYSQAQIRQALIDTARNDSHTGSEATLPDGVWGYGKLDANAAAREQVAPAAQRHWVRIRPQLVNWTASPLPPTFEITANENGTAVIALAWDPQAMRAPSSDYEPPYRFYSTDRDLAATVGKRDGSTLAVDVRAENQVIRLQNNRASWTVPQDLWDAYREEVAKSSTTPPTTAFARRLYYRVWFQPTGASAALAWPPDERYQDEYIRRFGFPPNLYVIPLNRAPSTQVVPDRPAVEAMGANGRLLTFLWENLPEDHPDRQALVNIFGNTFFTNHIETELRGKILRLWLFSGPSRSRLHHLLDMRFRTAAGLEMTILKQPDLRGGKILLDHLLELLTIVPHPDISASLPEQLVDDVVTEILDPNGQLNQGRAGMCAPTSLQTLLLNINAAEYARLQTGLLSSAGSATLANGDRVDLPAGIFDVARYAGSQSNPFYIRTNAELAFQAAVLKYAQGSRFPSYDPSAPPDAPNGVHTVFQATMSGGLRKSEMDRALAGLTGRAFRSSAQGPSDSVRDEFLTQLGRASEPLLLAIWWGGKPPAAEAGGHAVLALRNEGGRIFFKNPQYAGSRPPAGAVRDGSNVNPPRRYEDPGQTLESIGDADLGQWIMWYHTSTP